MQVGHFNLNDYLSKLNEEEAGSVKDSGEGLMIQDGESKKAYDWLKKEYTKGKTEVKVEMKMGGQKFEPSMELQTDVKSVNNFKSGIFGQVKTSDTEGSKKSADIESRSDELKSGSDSENENSEGQKPAKKLKKGPVKIEATSKKKKKEKEESEDE
jgi:hypothetical protein